MEFKEALMAIGFGDVEASVAEYLIKNNSSFSYEMERKLELRQPEVSVATRRLRERGWVSAEKVANGQTRKGRPRLLFKIDIGKVKNELNKYIDGEIEKLKSAKKVIEKL